MTQTLSKKKLIDEIQNYLANELRDLLTALETPGAVEPEASESVATRAEEIKQQLIMYKFLPVREYGPEDVICPGGLVELEFNRIRAFYLMVPKGGGLVMKVDEQAVQVITPNSPLGEVLLGKQVGDEAKVQVGGRNRDYKIVGFY